MMDSTRAVLSSERTATLPENQHQSVDNNRMKTE
jgi:hypothetical protein